MDTIGLIRILCAPIAILDRGRAVGLWMYDTATGSIAWRVSIQKNSDLEKAVARTEEFVCAQLGDARSFSLDSPKSRAPGIEALRQPLKRQAGDLPHL